MNELNVFFIIVWIVMVVFGVLQIVLFFKLWKMTDNVRIISENFQEKDCLTDTQIRDLVTIWASDGNYEKAKEILYPVIYESKEFKDIRLNRNANEAFVEKCIDSFNNRFKEPISIVKSDIADFVNLALLK